MLRPRLHQPQRDQRQPQRLHHHHHRRLPWLVALAVLVLVSIYPPAALADESAPADSSSVTTAERRAAEAFAAYNKKEYASAISLYLEAYDAAPSGSILYNIARIYDLKLHNRPSAIAFYRRYLADPGAQSDLADIANQRIRELRSAEIATARMADQASLAEGAAAPRMREPSPRPTREIGQEGEERRGAWSSLRWTGVALGTAGLAGIGIGGGFGLAAMSQAGTARDLCDGNACSTQRGVDAANTARTRATVATIGFAAGAALLLTGAALYLLGGERVTEESAVHLDARASASAASLQMVGRW